MIAAGAKLWIYSGFLLTLSQLRNSAQGAGILEVRLLSYFNDLSRDNDGDCCHPPTRLHIADRPVSNTGHCPPSCHPVFRICLKQWQNPVLPDPPCYFGSRIIGMDENSSAVIRTGRTRWSFNRLKGFREPLQFSFTCNWPGTMSLIMEVWHDNISNHDANLDGITTKSRSSANGKQLLIRVAELRRLKVDHEWTHESHANDNSRLDFQYRVICDQYYYGHDCTHFCRPRDDQYGHHVCTADGRKRCMDGWTGALCNQAVCKPGCHPENGHCSIPGECQCYLGYQGELCDKCVRYPGCVHGTCQRSFECRCEEGWGGLFCNQDLNFCTHHKPCKNGATCINTGSGHYACQCQPGFTGVNCEHRWDTCHRRPCLHGAPCIDKNGSYECVCPSGYSGRHCQSNARTCRDVPCENGGTCLDSKQGYECLCPFGFEGSNCDVERDECAAANPCLNGGTCTKHPLSTPPFPSHPLYDCACPIGFAGPRCEVNINDCSLRPCLNGGTCTDLVGSFRCQCAPGFMGGLCQDNIDDCVRRPCENGGSCIDLINDYRCMCPPGFRGEDCSVNIDECQSSPCRNGGTCIDEIDSYQCECQACFRGFNCQQRNDDCVPHTDSANDRDSVHKSIDRLDTSERSKETNDQVLANSVVAIGIPVLLVFILALIVLTSLVIYLYRKAARRLDVSNNRYSGIAYNSNREIHIRNRLDLSERKRVKEDNKDATAVSPLNKMTSVYDEIVIPKGDKRNLNLSQSNYYKIISNETASKGKENTVTEDVQRRCSVYDNLWAHSIATAGTNTCTDADAPGSRVLEYIQCEDDCRRGGMRVSRDHSSAASSTSRTLPNFRSSPT